MVSAKSPITGSWQGRTRSSCAGFDFEMDDLGIGGEACRIAGDAIIKTGAEDQQQIVLMQRHVGGPGAVHGHHTQIVWSLGVDRAEPVYRGKGRDIQVVKQLAEVVHGAREFRTRSD